MTTQNAHQLPHWRKNRLLVLALTAIWGGATVALVYWAPLLSFSFLGWQFGYWLTAQGIVLFYLALIGFYVWCAGKIDKQHTPNPSPQIANTK